MTQEDAGVIALVGAVVVGCVFSLRNAIREDRERAKEKEEELQDVLSRTPVGDPKPIISVSHSDYKTTLETEDGWFVVYSLLSPKSTDTVRVWIDRNNDRFVSVGSSHGISEIHKLMRVIDR